MHNKSSENSWNLVVFVWKLLYRKTAIRLVSILIWPTAVFGTCSRCCYLTSWSRTVEHSACHYILSYFSLSGREPDRKKASRNVCLHKRCCSVVLSWRPRWIMITWIGTRCGGEPNQNVYTPHYGFSVPTLDMNSRTLLLCAHVGHCYGVLHVLKATRFVHIRV